MPIDDIKIFFKNENDQKILIQLTKNYNLDIEIELGIQMNSYSRN